jgi:hypothetical protein
MSALDLRSAVHALPRSATLAGLSEQHPRLRPAAIATWRGRMVNEYGSARVFAGLAEHLAAASRPELRALAPEVREFAAEERRHGVLCASVVEALGGTAVASALTQSAYPRHEQVPETEAILRNVLSICCLSETVAVALIGAEREEMPDGPLRDLLTTIWADEIGHARFGWRVVPQLIEALDERARARTSRYLAVALEALQDHELAHLPARRFPDEGKTLGLCNGSDARNLFFATVQTVILPRLASLGLVPAEPRQASLLSPTAAR